MKEGDKIYKCKVCGHLGLWDDKWSWRFEMVKLYGIPHEQTFEMCSDKCVQKDKENNSKDKRRKI